jgi:hypothetical protein
MGMSFVTPKDVPICVLWERQTFLFERSCCGASFLMFGLLAAHAENGQQLQATPMRESPTTTNS